MRNRIYVNIQFKPKIWGLYFHSLFSILGGFVMGMMMLTFATDILISLFLNFCIFGSMLIYFFYRDNRDEIEYKAKKSRIFKKRVTSYTFSDQRVKILSK